MREQMCGMPAVRKIWAKRRRAVGKTQLPSVCAAAERGKSFWHQAKSGNAQQKATAASAVASAILLINFAYFSGETPAPTAPQQRIFHISLCSAQTSVRATHVAFTYIWKSNF